jgi:hypothetical protein
VISSFRRQSLLRWLILCAPVACTDGVPFVPQRGDAGGNEQADGASSDAASDAGNCDATADGCGGEGVSDARCGETVSQARTARHARSSGFSGAADRYAELFALACSSASECVEACTARGGTADMCGASECQDDSMGGHSCLPPPVWTNLESIQFEATSPSDSIQQIVVPAPYRDALLTDQFRLEVPTSASIEGIVVDVRRASTGFVTDDSVELVKQGAAGGAERASSTAWGSDFEWVSYGSPQDLWGLDWTPADVNADDFGVALSVLYTQAAGNTRAYVDQVRVTIHYRTACVP